MEFNEENFNKISAELNEMTENFNKLKAEKEAAEASLAEEREKVEKKDGEIHDLQKENYRLLLKVEKEPESDPFGDFLKMKGER